MQLRAESGGNINLKVSNPGTKSSMGRRSDLGNAFFRSSWEANYARYLNFLKGRGEVSRWEYEPDTFWFDGIKRGVRSYKPDFKVWPAKAPGPHYVEIKGWMDPRSKTKLKRMKTYHPGVRVVLVGAAEYRGLDRTIGRVLPGWERPRGNVAAM